MIDLSLGCCGWAYADWRGPFYPVDTPSGEQLSLYSQAFQTVEVDNTFYRPPTEANVRAWSAKVPDRFRFALKVPQVITHEKKLVGADGDFEDFVNATAAFGPKRGPLLLQFPRFPRSDFETPADFLRRLDAFLAKADKSVRIAVEVRNADWFDEAFLDLLRDHAAAPAITDQFGGPPTPDRVSRLVTSDFAYLRLLGNRARIEAMTKTWDATVIDRTSELVRWAEFLRGMAAAFPDVAVSVFANNHYSGHAPSAVRKLAAILDAKP